MKDFVCVADLLFSFIKYPKMSESLIDDTTSKLVESEVNSTSEVLSFQA